MFTLLSWLIYGLIVGVLGKVLVSLFFPAKDVQGILPTILVGVVGSYVGGFLNFVLGNSYALFAPSGIIMGTIGAALAIAGLHYFNTESD